MSRGRLIAVALAILLPLLLAGWQWSEAVDARAEVAKANAATEAARREFSDYREAQERKARQALETQARNAALNAKKRQEAADAEHLARKAAEADAAHLRQSHGQLQRYATDLATSLGDRARDPAAAGSCPTTDRIRQLADVLGQVDDFAAEVVRAADEARRAGLLCERTYDALRPGS